MTTDGDKRNLIEYVARSLESEKEFHFLRFEFLQRLNIVQQEVDLVRTKSRLQREGNVSEEDLTGLKTKLDDYSKRSCSLEHQLLIQFKQQRFVTTNI